MVLSEERTGPGATPSSSKAESAKQCSMLQSGSVQSSVVQYSAVRCGADSSRSGTSELLSPTTWRLPSS